jgi:hypothetical protein
MELVTYTCTAHESRLDVRNRVHWQRTLEPIPAFDPHISLRTKILPLQERNSLRKLTIFWANEIKNSDIFVRCANTKDVLHDRNTND